MDDASNSMIWSSN